MRTILLLLVAIACVAADAIVIRHDIDDTKYRASFADFPPLATFYRDGAHGTLIKPEWIITAAHATFCVDAGRFVKVGDGLYEVKRAYIHNEYQPGISHDIALVELTEKVRNIEPAKLYKDTNEAGSNVWFIGIGGTGTGEAGQTADNYENGGVLRKAQNKVVSAQDAYLRFIFDSGDNALPLEGVSGSGDSGGPAFIKDTEGYFLLGISSRVESGILGKYGMSEIYARTSFFVPWIKQIIEGTEEVRRGLSLPELKQLPAGLNKEILPAVCSDIALKPNQAITIPAPVPLYLVPYR